jgi:predicted small secreted protein/carbon monoxide dehydrogenase subunit G
MHLRRQHLVIIALLLVSGTLGGCLVAAAGAGAGGAIYINDRGVESLVATPMDPAFGAARAAFAALEVTETKTKTEQEGSGERRELSGETSDREITVTLRTEGSSTRVEVVVRRSAVTWDKDFARRIMEEIVSRSK